MRKDQGSSRQFSTTTLFAVACCLVALVFSLRIADAATFIVTSTEDVPDDVSNGACDTDEVAPGLNCTLRAALMEAAHVPGADVVDISSLTAPMLLSLPTVGTDSDSEGDLDVIDEVMVIGAGATQSVIDAGGATGAFLSGVFHVHAGASLTLRDLQIRNAAPSSAATALVSDGGTLFVEDSLIAVGTTTAVAVGDGSIGATFVMDGGELSGHGSAVSCTGAGTVELDQVTIRGHTATGAVDIEVGCQATIQRSAIVNNWGGGIQSAGVVTTLNSTVTGNQLPSFIYGTLAIDSSTFAGPAGSTFAPILSVLGSSVSVHNSIVGAVGQAPCIGGLLGGTGTLTSLGYNVFGAADSRCNVVGATTGNVVGDAKLDPALKLNGAGVAPDPRRTVSHAILPSSPAIDAGDPGNCAAIDQRGVSRPIGSRCDIGSFEAPICGNSVVESPEQCEPPSVAGVCDATCRFPFAPDADIPGGFNLPKSTVKTAGALVVAYEPCFTPTFDSTITSLQSSLYDGCIPLRSDPLCGFQQAPSGGGGITGAVGDYSVTKGTNVITFDVDLAKLEPACVGQELELKVGLRETARECNGEGCTISESFTAPEAIVWSAPTEGKCVVQPAYTCNLTARLNASSSPTLVGGRQASFEIVSLEVVRTGNGDKPSFVPGIFMP